MKPAKPASATMNEQTFVPASMRALYYSLMPTSDPALTGAGAIPDGPSTTTTISTETDTGLGKGLVLDMTFPTPQPSGHQYLLKNQAAAFCHDELRLSATLNPAKTTPQVPLHSLCGTVISTPAEDHARESGPRFKIGDVVFGLVSYTRDGGAADYTLATEEEIALKPANITAAEAAALALPALTAWQALFRYAGLDPDAPGNGNGHAQNGHKNGNGNGNGNGHSNGNGWRHKKLPPLRVLITNARDSEVGRIAVQLLRANKLFPASVRPWLCVSCTAAEEAIVRRDWDVDEVLVIPHLPTQPECDLGSMFRDRRWGPVDMVLDCAGGEVFRQAHAASVVKDYGAVLTAVDARPAQEPTAAAEQDPSTQRKRGLRSRFVPVNPDGAALARIGGLVEEHMVRGREETVVDLVDAAGLLMAGAAGTAGGRRGGMMVVRVN
ncbi:hypothetical protein NUU61_009049 [Penicillium alfredii]|uniref:Enoyl reductase (ER) domain-containing protein n=1 Tax=Penicillium alfredii TaxID=1506179 RepID=A0A9W9EMH4_9EURO|nr:uncharacterized protein NUU61_009049 [Penicillium alfredii]KAJ5084470.1 hypothetical protein NUU61_009049 [Penicillium alfredii]